MSYNGVDPVSIQYCRRNTINVVLPTYACIYSVETFLFCIYARLLLVMLAWYGVDFWICFTITSQLHTLKITKGTCLAMIKNMHFYDN